jgi:amino acid transporter
LGKGENAWGFLSSVPVLLLLLIITVIINIIWATSARQLTGILIIIVISATIVIIVIIIFKSQTRGNFSASWRRATLQGFIFPRPRA